MKIASVKKKIPSIANATPKTSPKRSMKWGHSSPISNDSTVPVTAPTNALVVGGPHLPILQPSERYESRFRITVSDQT